METESELVIFFFFGFVFFVFFFFFYWWFGINFIYEMMLFEDFFIGYVIDSGLVSFIDSSLIIT